MRSSSTQCTLADAQQVTTFLAGFSNAMAQALEGRDYGTYGYSCAGAIGYGSKGSWTSAFNQVIHFKSCHATNHCDSGCKDMQTCMSLYANLEVVSGN